MIKLNEILDTGLLKTHIRDGFISARPHPDLSLIILNYTQKAQYEPKWGDGVIDYCRGLIVDTETDEVIARPFKKFHNLNTASIPETMEVSLPNIQPQVTEKMDGSLGILWRYKERWGIATRGSFESPQAKWATKWYQDMLKFGQASLFEYYNTTALFEIIYPENRIVCKYDFCGLVLLALVDIRTGSEYPRNVVEAYGKTRGFIDERLVTDYSEKNLTEILGENEANREGYVLTYMPTNNIPPLKVKVKFEDYVRLHRLVTGVSPKAVWEMLAERKADWLDDQTLPEHFRIWATSWVNKLKEEFDMIFQFCIDIFLSRPYLEARKEIAEYFQTSLVHVDDGERYLGVLFAMLDNRPKEQIDKMIWKLIKPRGDDQTFRADGE